jgi:hypothetical protein
VVSARSTRARRPLNALPFAASSHRTPRAGSSGSMEAGNGGRDHLTPARRSGLDLRASHPAGAVLCCMPPRASRRSMDSGRRVDLACTAEPPADPRPWAVLPFTGDLLPWVSYRRLGCGDIGAPDLAVPGHPSRRVLVHVEAPPGRSAPAPWPLRSAAVLGQAREGWKTFAAI